jgi:hypothetical protein
MVKAQGGKSGTTGTREWIAVNTSMALPFGSRQLASSPTADMLHGEPSIARSTFNGRLGSTSA